MSILRYFQSIMGYIFKKCMIGTFWSMTPVASPYIAVLDMGEGSNEFDNSW